MKITTPIVLSILLLLMSLSYAAGKLDVPMTFPIRTGLESGQHMATPVWAPVEGAAGYNVYWTSETGKNYVKINKELVTNNEFGPDKVDPGMYYYVVTAVDADGNESAYSPRKNR